MNLHIGYQGNKKFDLPPDLVVQKTALMGISGSGKSCTAAVFAEEMCKASLPWIALDPVSVWYGLRAFKDGSPSNYPVVVFGGEHGDLPLEKGAGAKIAEALTTENVFAVIDLSLESKKFWHQFVTDFALTLMQLNPETPRHIFVEEAPEFIPQKAKFELTARCKEAMERLVRLGRNRGYGYTLITQRPATVDKDALSQCENLFVLRTVGAHDRKALLEWLQGKTGEQKFDKFLNDLPKLNNGEGYFWSPQWRHEFTKMAVRERETFHPGETRKIGKALKSVALCDVRSFVEKIRPQLTKVTATVPTPMKATPSYGMEDAIADYALNPRPAADPRVTALEEENRLLKERLSKSERSIGDASARLERVRQFLRPQYETLKALFEDIGTGSTVAINEDVYSPWLNRIGGKRRKMLEVIISRRELTRAQLSTLSGCSINSSGFKNSLSWMKVNKLINVEGDKVTLAPI